LRRQTRLFHRPGELRFTIEDVILPRTEAVLDQPISKRASQRVQGELVAVEADPKTVKVDSEGTATESKTRLPPPSMTALVAAESLDNDPGKQTAFGTGTAPNTNGRTLGGLSGFGLGTFAATGPRSWAQHLASTDWRHQCIRTWLHVEMTSRSKRTLPSQLSSERRGINSEQVPLQRHVASGCHHHDQDLRQQRPVPAD
jgi:hypothetical protein